MTSVCLLNYYHFNRIAHSKVFPSSRQEAICAARVCRDIHPVKRVYSRVFVRRSWTATAVRKSNHQIKRSREVPFVSARHGMVLCGEGDRGEIHADGFMMCGDYRSRWWWLFIVDHNKVCGQVLSIDKTEYFFYWAGRPRSKPPNILDVSACLFHFPEYFLQPHPPSAIYYIVNCPTLLRVASAGNLFVATTCI